jgi:hypothetical protein
VPRKKSSAKAEQAEESGPETKAEQAEESGPEIGDLKVVPKKTKQGNVTNFEKIKITRPANFFRKTSLR